MRPAKTQRTSEPEVLVSLVRLAREPRRLRDRLSPRPLGPVGTALL